MLVPRQHAGQNAGKYCKGRKMSVSFWAVGSVDKIPVLLNHSKYLKY